MRAGHHDEADDLLAGQWESEGDWRIKRVSNRVRSMAAADEEPNALFRERARLLDLAADHHLAGRYDASVPILLAHIEGIVIDVTEGKKYFTKRPDQKADVVNPDDLAGIEACMAALQGVYGEAVPRHPKRPGACRATASSTAGSWPTTPGSTPRRRGRSWTRSSTGRCLSRGPSQRRAVAARQAANPGSEDTDERGRRVDHREIAETRDALRHLGTLGEGLAPPAWALP